jgi:RNA polymerase sigma-70 factor (ECF subfamily)
MDMLYRRYGPMVLRRARAILGDEHAAHDLMQEVFLRALREGAQFRHEAAPVTWLYRATTNLCLNVLRDGARRQRLMALQPALSANSETKPDDKVALAAVLRQIPHSLREIAVYYYLDQMNQDEIAEVCGVSRRTVGNRLDEFRALARAAAEELQEVAS